MEAIRIIQDIINSVDIFEAEYQRIYEEIGKCDLEVCDILHDIELTSFNACEGYKMAKEIQKVRQRRRELKDKKSEILIIKETVEKIRPTIQKLQGEITNIEEKQEFQLHRIYTPRIRTDLKVVKLQSAK